MERCNKEVMRHVQTLVFKFNKRNAWEIYLPLAQRIINSEVHSRTGVPPYSLVFGGKFDLTGGFLYSPISQAQNTHFSKWSSDMLSLQSKLIQIAQDKTLLIKTHTKQYTEFRDAFRT